VFPFPVPKIKQCLLDAGVSSSSFFFSFFFFCLLVMLFSPEDADDDKFFRNTRGLKTEHRVLHTRRHTLRVLVMFSFHKRKRFSCRSDVLDLAPI
jgi:hypothetical protein